MSRREFAVAVGLAVMLGGASPATAQLFWSAGIELTAARLGAGDFWIEVETNVTAGRDDRCDIGEEVLSAEAERALRRDAIPARRERSPAALEVSVIALPSGGDCALFVAVELDYWLPSSALGTMTNGSIRAFQHGRLLTGGSHRTRSRETVEEFVSVLANRLRREIDALQGAR